MEDKKEISELLQSIYQTDADYRDLYYWLITQRLGQILDYPRFICQLYELDRCINQSILYCEKHLSGDERTHRIYEILYCYQAQLKKRISVFKQIIIRLSDTCEAVGEYNFFAYQSDMKHLAELEIDNKNRYS